MLEEHYGVIPPLSSKAGRLRQRPGAPLLGSLLPASGRRHAKRPTGAAEGGVDGRSRGADVYRAAQRRRHNIWWHPPASGVGHHVREGAARAAPPDGLRHAGARRCGADAGGLGNEAACRLPGPVPRVRPASRPEHRSRACPAQVASLPGVFRHHGLSPMGRFRVRPALML